MYIYHDRCHGGQFTSKNEGEHEDDADPQRHRSGDINLQYVQMWKMSDSLWFIVVLGMDSLVFQIIPNFKSIAAKKMDKMFIPIS